MSTDNDLKKLGSPFVPIKTNVDYEKMKKSKDLDPAKASAMHAAGTLSSQNAKMLQKLSSPLVPFKKGGKPPSD